MSMHAVCNHSVTILYVLGLPSVQDYRSVECYTSISNCNVKKNGVTLKAIDCCGQGYIWHPSVNGTDQQCGACVGKTLLSSCLLQSYFH